MTHSVTADAIASPVADNSRSAVRPSRRERLEGRIARLLARLPARWIRPLIGEAPRVVDGHTLDPHVHFILVTQRRKGRPGLCEPTLAEGRQRYLREILAVTPTPTPVGMVREIRVEGAAGALAARHYTPTDSPTAAGAPPPLLLYLHGGGFAIGNLDTHDEPCRLLCRHAGVQVVSVAYRLAPECPFPGPVDDACAALRWAQRAAASLGADPQRVAVGGDSAGANLATVAALTLAREGRAPFAQLLIYPVTDVTRESRSHTTFGKGYLLERRDMDAFRELYLGADRHTWNDPRASPARVADLALHPPALIVTAGFDPLRDEGAAYAARLQLADVATQHLACNSLVHGFLHLTPMSPAARDATLAIATSWTSMMRHSPRQTA